MTLARRSRDVSTTCTDTNGLLVAAVVHEGDIQDRDGAPLVLAAIRLLYPWLRHGGLVNQTTIIATP
jgi:hypothetical protein